MICNNCGTDNERDFKFCVKCGRSLVDPNEVDYEQVDMGGYHSEEEYSSQNSGFSIGSGTFTINDRAPGDSGSALYTADELNDTDEEFDFSMYEDLASGGTDQELPEMPPQPAANSIPPSAPPPVVVPQNPYIAGQPVQPMMFPPPQIIGYDPSGMPIYGQPAQPMMFPPPQIIGYDPSGMPIYGQPAQPMMFPPPQIIGYDPSGMPIYGQPAQPMMFPPPQVLGYDTTGTPLYGQQTAPVFSGDPAAAQNFCGEQNTAPPSQSDVCDEQESQDSKFWKFFEGDGAYPGDQQPDSSDFFSKSSHVEE